MFRLILKFISSLCNQKQAALDLLPPQLHPRQPFKSWLKINGRVRGSRGGTRAGEAGKEKRQCLNTKIGFWESRLQLLPDRGVVRSSHNSAVFNCSAHTPPWILHYRTIGFLVLPPPCTEQELQTRRTSIQVKPSPHCERGPPHSGTHTMQTRPAFKPHNGWTHSERALHHYMSPAIIISAWTILLAFQTIVFFFGVGSLTKLVKKGVSF